RATRFDIAQLQLKSAIVFNVRDGKVIRLVHYIDHRNAPCELDVGLEADDPPLAPMAGAGFEPAKAEPRRLQRRPFDRSGTPPNLPTTPIMLARRQAVAGRDRSRTRP